MLNQETAKAARTDSGYILRAPRRMRVADAVAQYMRVPMGAGNSVPWDPLVAPYVIEPMNCLASREYDAVIFVGPARTGKTIGLIDGWVIYNVICDPADMLIIQMTEEKAREHSKKRLARTFRVSPEVVSRLSPNKNDNNVYDRTFLAGNYLKIGWPSVNIMSSSDYKCVALTDYDRFPEDIDGEGDAFSLASKRTTTFMSSGMTLVESSPGRDVKDVKWRRTSPHEAPPTTGILSLYNRGDRRRWYWPCPHCGEYFQPCGDVVAGFRDIADPVLASEAAYIQCPSCSGRILPEQKRELNGRGVWLRDGESINADGSRYGDPRRSRIASFWMEGPAAAYQTLSQLVYKLLTAEQEYETTGSEETLKTVINTDWGLPYLPRASMEQRKSELLEQRAEPVPSRSVPDGVNFLVATVDVQAGRHRRFVVQVTGYGSRGERWIIDRYNITQSLRGDSDGESQRIDPASYPEDWDVLLTDVFHKSWPLASDPSQQMRLMAMAVDSGGEDGVTDNAYKFWRRCRRDGLGNSAQAAAASQTASANSATAAKKSETNAKNSEAAAKSSETNAKSSETNAAKSAADALNYRNQAQSVVGNNIGLGEVAMTCTDISVEPSGYIGFIRIYISAKGYPSVASSAGDNLISGYIVRSEVSTKRYSGLFVGSDTKSLYSYIYSQSSGPQWIRHTRRDELSRFGQNESTTRMYGPTGDRFFEIHTNGSWGVYDSSSGQWSPLGLAQG
ncbi:phage terminase large subunit family protein, partial [Escherichia coli]|uniref:phage terminase large subunit family protein n=29 Tax=Escherichia coli TaxID=562 RepID=UPI00210ADE3B